MFARRAERMMFSNELISYAESRINEIKRLAPLLQLYGAQESVTERQIQAYQSAIDQLRKGATKEEIIRGLESRIRINSTINAIFYRDILNFIQKGKPLLPESLLDLPQLIHEERQRRIEQQKEQADQRSRDREQAMRKNEEEKKLAEREKIVQTLGLSRNLLAELSSNC
jgi:hypothetical protein